MLKFYSKSDPKKLSPVLETGKETTMTLAAAHALVLLEDGTIVGDPMEKTTLSALDWKLSKGERRVCRRDLSLIDDRRPGLAHGEGRPSQISDPHPKAIPVLFGPQAHVYCFCHLRRSGPQVGCGRQGRAGNAQGHVLGGAYVYDETYRWYTARQPCDCPRLQEMKIQNDQVGSRRRPSM